MKRSTETVLRAELEAKARELAKAIERRERADQATRDAHAAGVVAQADVDRAIEARDRARAVLETYLGHPLPAETAIATIGDPAPEGDSDVLSDKLAGGGSVIAELDARRRRRIAKADTVVDEGDEAPE